MPISGMENWELKWIILLKIHETFYGAVSALFREHSEEACRTKITPQ